MPTTLARRTLVAGALLGAVLTGSTAPAQNFQPVRAVVTADENAALRYWRAFALMDEDLRTLIGEETATLADPTFDASPELRKAVGDASNVIDQLTLGASMAQCDFGIDRDLGVEALLPHLSPMRTASRLLMADARLHIEIGDGATAASRIATALRLSAHATYDDLVISSLVGVAMYSQVKTVTERLLVNAELDAAERATIRRALAAFPAADPFRAEAALRSEAVVMVDWLRTTLKSDAGLEKVRDSMDLGDGSTDLGAFAALDAQALQSHVDLLRAAYGQLVAAWDAADPPAAMRKVNEEVASGAFGAIAPIMLPALDRYYQNVKKAEADLASFRERLAE
ncbi:MAG: hypothetical protein ACF8QF_07160 [Phycisphaerales bacterium]